MTDSIDRPTNDTDDTDGAERERPPLAPGEIDVTLTSGDESAVIRMPPFKSWKSSARSALLSRGDDMSWAALTLSREDAETWIDMDPTKEQVDRFFADFEKAGGMSNNRAERRRNLRAVS
jgi:hypothetical protein